MTSKNDNSDVSDQSALPKQTSLRRFIHEHLVCGILGGVLSAALLHPLDLIKTRYAAFDGRTVGIPQYTSLSNAFSTIVRQEGVLGLYRGAVPNLWGSGISSGVYFLAYNSFKTWAQEGDTKILLSPVYHMVAASGAGALTLIMTNPIWVVKTRLCLQYDTVETTALPQSKTYTGMVDTFRKTYQNEGMRGLYFGFVPGIFGISHGVLQFMVYEEMKNRYNKYHNVPIDTHLATLEYLVFAAASKLFAAAVTYPYQVVRVRLQDQHHGYKGLRDCLTQIMRFEGITGFFKGMGITLIRVVPGTMITFLIYENCSYHVLQKYPDETIDFKVK